MNYETNNSTEQRFLLLSNEKGLNEKASCYSDIHKYHNYTGPTDMNSRYGSNPGRNRSCRDNPQFRTANHHFHAHYRRQRKYNTQTSTQNQRNNCLQLHQEHIKCISWLIYEMLIQAKRSSHPPKT